MDPVLKGLNIPADYTPYVTIAAVLLVTGLCAPLIGALLRLIIAITVETIRIPIRSTRGISNELARVIYRHGPLFSQQVARPLALALMIGAGCLIISATFRGASPVQSAKKDSTAATSCSGEIVALTCPRPKTP